MSIQISVQASNLTNTDARFFLCIWQTKSPITRQHERISLASLRNYVAAYHCMLFKRTELANQLDRTRRRKPVAETLMTTKLEIAKLRVLDALRNCCWACPLRSASTVLHVAHHRLNRLHTVPIMNTTFVEMQASVKFWLFIIHQQQYICPDIHARYFK